MLIRLRFPPLRSGRDSLRQHSRLPHASSTSPPLPTLSETSNLSDAFSKLDLSATNPKLLEFDSDSMALESDSDTMTLESDSALGSNSDSKFSDHATNEPELKRGQGTPV